MAWHESNHHLLPLLPTSFHSLTHLLACLHTCLRASRYMAIPNRADYQYLKEKAIWRLGRDWDKGACSVILLLFFLSIFLSFFFLSFFLCLFVMFLSLSLSYPSIAACLHSLTPHGTSLTIISSPLQPINHQWTHSFIHTHCVRYYYLVCLIALLLLLQIRDGRRSCPPGWSCVEVDPRAGSGTSTGRTWTRGCSCTTM
jgi:hypothetical protein